MQRTHRDTTLAYIIVTNKGAHGSPSQCIYYLQFIMHPFQSGTHKLEVSNVAILDSGAYLSRAGGVCYNIIYICENDN